MNRITVFAKCVSLCAILFGAGVLASCEKESQIAPRITEVRRSAGAVGGAPRGVGIQILGEGLSSPLEITINNHPINMNTVWVADNSIFMQIPHQVPMISEGAVLDILVVRTAAGEATYSFAIVPGPPAVLKVNNPVPGEMLIIEGRNFFYVEYIEFPAIEAVRVTDFSTSAAGDVITVKVPDGFDSQYGDIEIQALVGRITLDPPPPPLGMTNIGYGPTVSTAYALPAIEEGVQLGALPYVDREANANNTIFSWPAGAGLEGATLLKTAVDGRAYTGGEPYIVFDIARQAEVIVVWNQGGMGVVPAWLSEANGWVADDPSRTDTSKAVMMGTADTKDTCWIYRKTFPAGTVELGRNGENADGSGRNTGRSPYFVIIK